MCISSLAVSICEWIGEQLAPQFGYQYGDDHLPVFEYYGYFKPEKNAHEFRYLYVPVEKQKSN